ncbi:lysis protein [Pseudomonas benzenivorans]|uniref:Lysis protein n=1 Tax=Pseudomonas benzenivorans TaxID=556533 RepID=A0ABZ0PSB1_9PSED|nr:lysis protein [Pseudomonas benzenivorans]WPC03470.1 lysis protein [Pseudomonas benzenivorans]
MNKYLVAVIAGLCAVLLVFALKSKIERLENELDLAQEKAAELEFLAQKTGEKLAARDEIDKKYAQELSDAREEIEGLRADVAAGNKRLRVKAVCPVAVPSSTSAASVDDAVGAELDPVARSDYFALRERVVVTEQRLAGLQDYVKNVCLEGRF